ncbi:hypothetical protein AGMMS4957_20220 [Bacteroidia bacterium]|nr:hypothetical protein AGMMS4957_20220 [Bacteroidia bacterium]
MKKNLVFNFISCSDIVLQKTFPYYIGKIHDMSASIVYRQDAGSLHLPAEHKGVKLIPLKFRSNGECFSFRGEWYFFWYFFKHAKEIDVLIRHHYSYQTAIIGWLYKWRNPHGIFHIFCDGYGVWQSLLRDETKLSIRIKNWFIRQILNKAGEIADKVSIELLDIYQFLQKQKPFLKTPEKLILMRWGIDEEVIEASGMQEIPVAQKENLIISVGRHGSKQKNTELLLEALKKVDLSKGGGYEVVFIGAIETIECDFQATIDAFFDENPHLKDKVRFIGAIYDKPTYFDWFNRAKIFVHTAVYESYGIVIGEAFRFNNYIISTDTGCAKELIAEGMGEIVENNADDLSRRLQRVIDGETDIPSIYREKKINNRSISWENEVLKLGAF